MEEDGSRVEPAPERTADLVGIATMPPHRERIVITVQRSPIPAPLECHCHRRHVTVSAPAPVARRWGRIG